MGDRLGVGWDILCWNAEMVQCVSFMGVYERSKVFLREMEKGMEDG